MMIICLLLIIKQKIVGIGINIMKPYAFNPLKKNDTGCCPGHDWPRCRRWAGRYSSAGSKKADKYYNDIAKRIRRHLDKATTKNEDRKYF